MKENNFNIGDIVVFNPKLAEEKRGYNGSWNKKFILAVEDINGDYLKFRSKQFKDIQRHYWSNKARFFRKANEEETFQYKTRSGFPVISSSEEEIKQIDHYVVIKVFPGVVIGNKFRPHNLNKDGTVKDYSGERMNLQNFHVSAEEIANSEFFKAIYKAKYELPIIAGYKGELVDGGWNIKYGCAKFNIHFFKDLYEITKVHGGVNTTRKIKSIKLDSDIEISIEQINQIIEYLDNEK